MDSRARKSRLLWLAALAAGLFAIPVGSAAANPDGVGRSTTYAYGSVGADGHQVSGNVASGNLTFTEDDVPLPNTEGLAFSRTYNSALSSVRRDLGFGWTTNAGYDVRLTVSGSNLQLVDATGHRVDFTANGSGGYTSSNDDYAAEALPGGGWQITVPPPGDTLTFNAQGMLSTTTIGDDALGYTYTSAGGQDRLSSIVDPGTTNTRPGYNGDGSIIEIDDPASQHYYYGYNGAKQLTSFAGPGGASATYGYDTGGRINAISWSGGSSAAVTYDSNGRVTQIVGTSADSSVDAITFAYSTSVTGCPVLSVGTTVVVDSDGEGATYCWRADYVITKITPIDTVAPGVSAAGDLVDASNHYAPLDDEQTVTLLGSDDRSGIRQLRLDVDGTTVASVNATCDDGQLGTACPLEFGAEVEYDPSGLAPGEHTFTAVAVDDAGNIGSSESWTVTIDRTGPSETDELIAMFDPDEDETWIQWAGDEDPDSVATPGAGMGSWRYRYKRNSGSWSTYRDVHEPNATLAGGDVGDTIKVQVTPSDRAGNAANETEVETTAELGYEDGDDPSARSADANAVSRHDADDDGISCTPENDDTDLRFLSSYASQAFIAIEATGTMNCIPELNFSLKPKFVIGKRISFMACPVYQGEPLVCDDEKFTITKRLKTRIQGTTTFTSKGLAMCLPGTKGYRVHFDSDHFDQTEVRGDTETFDCNEAGAWRRLATRAGDPGEILGNRMPDGYNSAVDQNNIRDEQPVPDRGVPGKPRRGWEAHHIIPANISNPRILAAQAAGYACNIPPNGAVNGVWLRGPELRASSDDDSYYQKLRPSQRRHDYHRSVHTNRYLIEVSSRIKQFVNSNGTCKTNGQADIANELREEFRSELKTRTYTKGSGK